MVDEGKVRRMVRKVVERTLSQHAPQQPAGGQKLITELDLKDLPPNSQFRVPAGSLVTPLARQTAMDLKIRLIEEGGRTPLPAASRPSSGGSDPGKGSVALGADHGGFELKDVIKGYLDELGYPVIDCGTHSAESVDYPDYAFAVAELVSKGKAWRGILIDGAGIGSCMAANKVPGVRAGLCYDLATAVNSREHNHANVLTLGAGLIGANLARQIVKAWLETPAGGGRHARRVDKIMDIEGRFLKG